MAERRRAPGVREVGPGLWELVAEAGRDPVSGKRRRVTTRFRGNFRDAKKARAKLVAETSSGRHEGTRATLDDLCAEWLAELRRLKRKPATIHNYERVYNHDIRPTLGKVQVRKVGTKMLTDLYRAHEARGAKAHTIYQVHATISSMMTQACRWGWRGDNPARHAVPTPRDNPTPISPTPAEVRLLVAKARALGHDEYARFLLFGAVTGGRRGEICGLRFCHIDGAVAHVQRSIGQRGGQIDDGETKNRKKRPVALGPVALAIVEAQRLLLQTRAAACGATPAKDAFVFSSDPAGRTPWKPDTVTQFFGRLRSKVGVRAVLQFKHLRKFMETYGQELGFSDAQVAIRAGHDPAVAARHYTGRVSETDEALAEAIESLIEPAPPPKRQFYGRFSERGWSPT